MEIKIILQKFYLIAKFNYFITRLKKKIWRN